MNDEENDYICCTECNEVMESTWDFDVLGDGNCKSCKGKGELDDYIRGRTAEIVSYAVSFGFLSRKFPYTKECQNCYGTGQCQLCGGTGRVKQSRFEEFNMSMLDEKNSESSNDIELEEFGVSSNSESKIDPVNTVTNIFLGAFYGLITGAFFGFFKGCGLFHYDPHSGIPPYLFSFDDAIPTVFYCSVIGAFLGLLRSIWNNYNK